ncbi:MAG: choice-of-anchor L domain-containing protein [Polyangiaceae bacterium]
MARSRNVRLAWLVSLPAAVLALGSLAMAGCGPAGTSSGGGAGGGTTSECGQECGGLTPVCDPDSKTCVGCLPSNDTCDAGKYCDMATMACVDGCKGDPDCTSPKVCDPTSHQCVSCTEDSQCQPGEVCNSSGGCVPGCNDSQPCAGGQACCSGACADLNSDPKSCGTCDKPCAIPDHAEVSCVQGMCQMGMCDAGYADCDQNPDTGCEAYVGPGGTCSCTPGDTQACYTGAAGTEGVGTCKGGTSTCDPTGTMWGACMGQVTPVFDACADGLDNDCDGVPDNAKDLDGDGWTPCDGDCCDVAEVGVCGDPILVNPGAFEVDGNMVDDNCDGVVDNPIGACDQNLVSNSNTPTDYAKAIDLCQSTSESPPSKKDKIWGVITGSFTLVDGSGSPAANAKSIRQGFGSGVAPLAGSRIAVLSTGVAAAKTAPNNTAPAYAAFQGGQDLAKSSPMPADWLAANANNLPNAPGCPDPQGGTTAHDPIMLKLRIRVPTNAKSFAVSTNFYSSEYPEWVCSPFNDFFVTLLDSQFVPGAGQVANPTDKNLAFYKAGNKVYPVGVNLAFGSTGLFTQCQTSSTGCGTGAIAGNNTCMSTAQLVGTGFDDPNLASQFPGDPAYCDAGAKYAGGATGWLTTNGNVKPGETIEIRFATWDTGDGWYDSVVLLDNWVWSVDASTPGTHQ